LRQSAAQRRLIFFPRRTGVCSRSSGEQAYLSIKTRYIDYYQADFITS
jgi:hypothetical protein